MVAHLLCRAGLYLGESADLMPASESNTDGHWEHIRLVALNEQLLNDYGGGWDAPPNLPENWSWQSLSRYRSQAETLTATLAGHDHWGWKDPRNSLTLPFWLELFPELKVVVCLRHPLEVAFSLRRRNYFSFAHSLNLWRAYYQAILAATRPANRLIVAYDTMLLNSQPELRRLLAFTGLSAAHASADELCTDARTSLRHHTFSMPDLIEFNLAPEIVELYVALCRESLSCGEAGYGVPANVPADAIRFEDRFEQKNRQASTASRSAPLPVRFGPLVDLAGIEAEALRRENENFRLAVAQRDAEITKLTTELESGRRQLEAASANLEIRDKENHGLQAENAQLRKRSKSLVRNLKRTLGAIAEQAHRLQELGELLREMRLSAAEREDENMEILYEIHGALAAIQSPEKAPSAIADYVRTVSQIRQVVRRLVPRGATVLVTSKGDPELCRLFGRRGWHFPQDAEGTYPGFYPADSSSAIVQLEALRAKGADYFLLPRTSFWWRESYPEFARHLDGNYRLLTRDLDPCRIYSLTAVHVNSPNSTRFADVLREFEDRYGTVPIVLDWCSGSNIGAMFPGYTFFTPTDCTADDLPYLDKTIDIVILPSSAGGRSAEAERAARGAVVLLSSGTETGVAAPVEVRWTEKPSREPLPSASIVIPSYNGVALTEACLDAIFETLPDKLQVEVIVVDDCSGDDTQVRLAARTQTEPRLKVLRNPQNCGFLMTCNRGASAAGNDIVILLNNDTLPQRGWLDALLRVFRERPDVGAVGGKLVYPDGRLQEAGGVVFRDGSAANFGRGDYHLEDPLYNYLREVDYVTGALIATPRELFNRLGQLDTHYRPIYYEETDYCFRIRREGLRVYYQPESVVIHLEGVTCGTDTNRGLKQYQVVNRQKFFDRWAAELQCRHPAPDRFNMETWHRLAVIRRDQEDSP
jgi:GT2 family glycosyltransferase